VIAVGIGTTLARVAAWRRWGVVVTILCVVLALVICSGLVAPVEAFLGWLPSPQSVGAAGAGVVTAWKDLVTILAPVGDTGAVLTVPLVLGLVGSVVSVTIAERSSRPTLAAVVPVVVLIGSILLGTRSTLTAVPVGLAVALQSMLWASKRSGRLHAERPFSTAILLVAAGVAGTLAAVPWQDGDQRTVIRDHVTPPPDVHDYPSPLAGFRSYLKDLPDSTVLTVEGMGEGDLVRVAAMDSYDGTAFTVAPGAEAGTGEFQRIGAAVDQSLQGTQDFRFTIGEYSDVWVPVTGELADIAFTSDRSTALSRSLYVNPTAGVGIVEVGLRAGDSYRLTAAPVERPDLTSLAAAPVADVSLPPITIPDSLAIRAGELTVDASTTLARIQAVESGLRQGYFSHGLEGDTPSLAGHGSARLDAMLTGEAMIGDEEQYSALMALMLRSMQIPARVVLGFEVPADGEAVQVTGDNVTAWVEVPFEQYGWVPFFPTPDEDRVWQQQNNEPQDSPQPQVLQPPPPVLEPPEAPPADRQDVEVAEDPEEDAGETSIVWVVLALSGGGLLLLLLIPVIIILAMKAARRRRRRTEGTTTERAAGSWSELVDVSRDLGAEVPAGATRSVATAAIAGSLGDLPEELTEVADRVARERSAAGETAGAGSPGGSDTDDDPFSATTTKERRTLRRAERALIDVSSADLAALAARADLEAFALREPSDRDVEKLWSSTADSIAEIRRAAGRRRWIRARLSTRSLRKRARKKRRRDR
jgi:transglutaminase-like putative cysteine protease